MDFIEVSSHLSSVIFSVLLNKYLLNISENQTL